jgi:hypothetical protein
VCTPPRSREFYGEEWATLTLNELRGLDDLFTHPSANNDNNDNDVSSSPSAATAAAVTAECNTVPARYSTLAFHSEETVVPPPPPPPAAAAAPTAAVAPTAGTPPLAEKPVGDGAGATSDDTASETPGPTQGNTAVGSDITAEPSSSAHDADARKEATADAGASAPVGGKPAQPEPTAPTTHVSEEDRVTAALAELLKQNRRYSIDMCPRACLARGALIQLLISSNIGRYLEFKAVAETYIRMGVENREVPACTPISLSNTHA